MKLAVIGGGVSGLVCAYLLHDICELTLYEAAPTVGGHAHTIDADIAGVVYPIDTGFVVFNERTYPMFSRLLRRLGIAPRPTTMSFSVRDDARRIEYGTHALSTFLWQPHTWFDRNFFILFRDVVRFRRDVAHADPTLTLGAFLDRGGYEVAFRDFLVLPLTATVWSCSFDEVAELPLGKWWRFMENHGMLNILDPPQWLFIEGGSRRYVERLCAPFSDRIRTSTPIRRVVRKSDGVWIEPRDAAGERYDEVIMALHSDQALRLLDPPSLVEREVLGAIPYRDSDIVVHTDASVLPKRKRAWSSWNYRHEGRPRKAPTVTYNMNVLHQLGAPLEPCVSLNIRDVKQDSVLEELRWSHPRMTHAVSAAQARHADISGVDRIHYCGAYWGQGFHEDGVVSALRVAKVFGGEL